MYRPHKNIILNPEIVVSSLRQEAYIESLKLFDEFLENVSRWIIAATAGYIIYLMVALGTPAIPTASTSKFTPEQNRENFAVAMGCLSGIITLALCYVDWRTLWQWTVSEMKRLSHKVR